MCLEYTCSETTFEIMSAGNINGNWKTMSNLVQLKPLIKNDKRGNKYKVYWWM